jgi:hypothetical protein
MFCQNIVSAEVCLAGLRKLTSLLKSVVINYKFLPQIFINSQILFIVLTLSHFDTECELYVLLWNVNSQP